jgi:hypothetical protein
MSNLVFSNLKFNSSALAVTAEGKLMTSILYSAIMLVFFSSASNNESIILEISINSCWVKFDLSKLSSKAVYVYYNSRQLLVNYDYEFNSIFGFVNLKIDLIEGDRIQIREYVSTAINFIPPTPTKLGLYKKYTPKKFLDDTYVVPKEVIQGHDGSITIAYGDFRDDVLLELEYRIYNNIKQEYNENVFDVDLALGGYYGNSKFNKTDVDNIVTAEFLKWISGTSIDYVSTVFLIPKIRLPIHTLIWQIQLALKICRAIGEEYICGFTTQ